MGESAEPTPGRIFLSYRREETAYPAGWLYDRLADRYGGGQVFKDVDSIRLGDDFVEVITRAVASCDVLLALLGDQWLTITDEDGRRRLDDPADFVRVEIEAALSRNVRVIPILVDGARMPRSDELPPSLARLVRRQALELSPAWFEFDTSRLLRVLDETLAEMRNAHDDSAAMSGPAANAPDASTVEPPTAPERRQQAEPTPTRPITPAAPAVPAGPSPSDSGKPPGRQRRRVSNRTLVLAGAGIGVLLTVLIVAILAISQTPPSPTENAADRQGIQVDSSPATSDDGIELTELRAASRNDPPQVGDTVTVSYSLTNHGDQPIQLAYTFVGVRNPADDHRDTEDMNEETLLSPGETVNAQGRIPIDSAGTWEVWPCYEISGGRQCPDKWQVFYIFAK